MPAMTQHPDRVLPLQGATNFRDLGGYRGHEGRSVRWRRLFRSDHLGGLTPADKALLRELGVAHALDFRGLHERAAEAYELPGVEQHALHIEPTVVQRMQQQAAAGRRIDGELVTELMHDLYRGLVTEQAHRYAELFDHLLHSEAPLVFHCTAGKDRTGVGAALILLALGVPRELVLQDYLLTNEVFRHPPHAGTHDLPADARAVLWRVQPGFLQTALEVVDAEHGGVEHFLAQRLGVTPQALALLRSRYLSPA
jgi:protein-tyrosine phosphatase